MRWVEGNQQIRPDAISEVADAADGWVAAYAKVHGLTVVTHERHDPHIRRRVPLVNVCHEFQLPVKDTFEMLQELGVQFHWSG